MKLENIVPKFITFLQPNTQQMGRYFLDTAGIPIEETAFTQESYANDDPAKMSITFTRQGTSDTFECTTRLSPEVVRQMTETLKKTIIQRHKNARFALTKVLDKSKIGGRVGGRKTPLDLCATSPASTPATPAATSPLLDL